MNSAGDASKTLKACLWLCLGLAIVVGQPGCSGCRTEDPAAAKKRKEEEELEARRKAKAKPKPDFEVARLRSEPSDSTFVQVFSKPGHYIAASQQMVANNFDFSALLESMAVDQNGKPLLVPHTPFSLSISRPAALPKGQAKYFEMIYMAPLRTGNRRKTIWFENKLRARHGGREVAGGMQPTTSIPDHQYLFVVLAADPDRYGYVKRLESIAPPSDDLDPENNVLYYRVALPRIVRRAPVPSHPLLWTTIAYVLWDEIDPNMLNPDQQQALLDWLHWGGQIVVSGPNSLDMIKGSFLDTYMPVEKVKAIELRKEDFQELNDYWSLTADNRKKGEKRKLALEILEDKPLVGVEMENRPEAEVVRGTGGLVVERRVGNGRIVVTAFSLSDRDIVNWKSYDGFFNSALLRRPRRQFGEDEVGMLVSRWADHQKLTKDARLSTTLRYFSRDIGGYVDPAQQGNTQQRPPWEMERSEQTEMMYNQWMVEEQRPRLVGHNELNPDIDDWRFNGYSSWPQSGVAGWNDRSGAADAARDSLKEAAGISIPKADFVLKVLAVYLLVLVPVNWGLFRAIGRVEWAWVAAPLIAIVGAVAVVRLAQLDIGFARSRTEVAVLEAQGGYDSAHLTRFTALYTSLSTGYDIEFEDDSALALPFAVDPGYELGIHDQVTPVTFRRDKGVSLSGFKVASNSTGIVHSEQMFDLGGEFELVGDADKGYQLQNGSDISLRDVGVLYRTSEGAVMGAWVGDLASQTSVALQFSPIGNGQLHFNQWDSSAALGHVSGAGQVGLSRLRDIATKRLRLNPGDVRLIGWTDEDPQGMEVYPRASQATHRTLALIHLRRGALPDVQRDLNSKYDHIDVDARSENEEDTEATIPEEETELQP